MGVHKKAVRQISERLGVDNADEIARKVWINLGHSIAEFVHLDKFTQDNIIFDNLDVWHEAKASGKPVVFITAHIANWEIPLRAGFVNNFNIAGLYKPASNPYFNKFTQKVRENVCYKYIPKGREGMRTLLKELKGNGFVGFLIDQHVGDGEPIEFLGREAKTSLTPAELAIKYNALIVPCRTIRNFDDNSIKMISEPPIDIEGKDAVQITKEISGIYEKWILDTPEQWFWLHNRWR